MKARVNRGSLDKKMDMLRDKAEEAVKDELREIAVDATRPTIPVYSGAFVTSWSIKDSYSSGRSRTSRGKPKATNPEAKRQEGREQLFSDIAKLSIFEGPEVSGSPLFVLSNGAPHANKVAKLRDIVYALRDKHG